MKENDLKAFLDFKAEQFENPNFIELDPICIPHQYHRKEDIEIMGLIVSTIAWGNRKSIINSGKKLIKILGSDPFDFVMSHNLKTPIPFVHRTFNSEDLMFFLNGLKNIYSEGSMESLFSQENVKTGIISFRQKMLENQTNHRSKKHLSNPMVNSACKRLNMFLRWMVRSNAKGVDFGLWSSIPASKLLVPLDVHTGNIARKLELLHRKQNDWKALEELMEILRSFDPADPVKYDFALFSLGAVEDF